MQNKNIANFKQIIYAAVNWIFLCVPFRKSALFFALYASFIEQLNVLFKAEYYVEQIHIVNIVSCQNCDFFCNIQESAVVECLT